MTPLRKLAAPLLLLIFMGLVAHRVWRSAAIDANPSMGGAPLSTAAEQALYFTPAGRYTEADIKANGDLPPSQKYRGFQAKHDFNPMPGDVLCPISRTKASQACSWVIDGQTYYFCCPPCIDELVRLAKERPGELKAPAVYIQR
jgi:hypothetical protein